MNAKYTLIAAAAGAVMMSGCATTENGPEAIYYSGGEPTLIAGEVPKTRREIYSEIVQAYREGTLHPVGEEWAYPYVPPCTPQKAFRC